MPNSTQKNLVDSGDEAKTLQKSKTSWSGAQQTRYDQIADFRRLSQVPVLTASELTSLDALRTTLGYT